VGEDRQDATGPPPAERVSVPQAADHLGTTVGALRKRVQRGTIPYERDHAGRVWILLDTGRPRQDTGQDTDQPLSDVTALISAKDETIVTLREQLEDLRRDRDEWREQARVADRLLSAAMERIPPQLEAPQEAAETVEEASDRAEPRSATGGAQEGEQRPWWRRVFGS
jgi:hypothetical protein